MALIFVAGNGGITKFTTSINPLERSSLKVGFSATQFRWLNASYSVAACSRWLIRRIIMTELVPKKAFTLFCRLCLLGAILEPPLRGSPES